MLKRYRTLGQAGARRPERRPARHPARSIFITRCYAFAQVAIQDGSSGASTSATSQHCVCTDTEPHIPPLQLSSSKLHQKPLWVSSADCGVALHDVGLNAEHSPPRAPPSPRPRPPPPPPATTPRVAISAVGARCAAAAAAAAFSRMRRGTRRLPWRCPLATAAAIQRL